MAPVRSSLIRRELAFTRRRPLLHERCRAGNGEAALDWRFDRHDGRTARPGQGTAPSWAPTPRRLHSATMAHNLLDPVPYRLSQRRFTSLPRFARQNSSKEVNRDMNIIAWIVLGLDLGLYCEQNSQQEGRGCRSRHRCRYRRRARRRLSLQRHRCHRGHGLQPLELDRLGDRRRCRPGRVSRVRAAAHLGVTAGAFAGAPRWHAGCYPTRE